MKKGKILKISLILGGGYTFLMLLLMLGCVAAILGSPTSNGGMIVPVEEEEVYDYQYVGAEIGVPWDIALLADVFLAEQNGQKLGELNPIFTSLQFCIVTERHLVRHMEETEELTPEGEIKWEAVWEETEAKEYTGLTEILSYMDIEGSRLADKSMEEVVEKLHEICEEKEKKEENPDIKYTLTVSVNEDLEGVLRDFIGLTEENYLSVMSLHNVQYLAQLYGYVYDFGETKLPELIVGEITREELAQVAVSLLGHPYLLGGKSPTPGTPAGPLDCSGYVDWVYIQCFGVGVSSGGIPEGVAVSGTALQWYACTPIEESELQVGDLAFLYHPEKLKQGKVNHVGIFIGEVEGTQYFIHCAGRSYGTEALPSGRVGISKRIGGANNYNCVTGGTFEPAMKSCNFRYFRRPNFTFVEDEG